MLYNMRGKISNVTPLTLDKTLTLEGASADAKAVGEAIEEAKRIAKEQNEAHGNLIDKNKKLSQSCFNTKLVDSQNPYYEA